MINPQLEEVTNWNITMKMIGKSSNGSVFTALLNCWRVYSGIYIYIVNDMIFGDCLNL
jgi:hypothetical protein